MPLDGTLPFNGTPERYDDPALDILIGARGLIKGGWIQKQYINRGYSVTRYCLVGAISEAAGVEYHKCHLYITTRRAAHLVYREFPWLTKKLLGSIGTEIDRLYLWNDTSWRWKKGVLRVLDRAISRRVREMRRQRRVDPEVAMFDVYVE